MPIRYAARLESGHTPSRSRPDWWENCNVPWFSLADVSQIRRDGADVIYETKEMVSELGLQNSSARKLPAGTVMLSRTASVGFSAIMGVEMATTQDFANWVCGPSLRPRFLLHVFRAMHGEFRRLMFGSTHSTIYMPDISALRFVLPSLSEQDAIVDFLERETAKIDALIEQQEKLIALLAEKRQATISHAVTRGLDPDAPMKDSSVAWSGDVPEHWDVTRLKFVATVQTGIAKGKDTTGKSTTAVPYLRVANVQDGFLALDDIATIEIEAEQLDRYRLTPGDVLMNEGGDFDKLGRGAVWHGEILDCIHQNHVFAVRPHGVSAAWLSRVTSSGYARFYFMGRSKQSTNLASISSSNIMELPLVLPPLEEQHHVMKLLDDELARLDALNSTAAKAVRLLQERRSALIAAAVTGQIDVRAA
ncbi:restriction endonuclease subunit S [Mitsuaria sp. 7]|uniref:restriction endonuclease subunit S n=1 Tax=Mitsuaria sp. 7 TaxID=1658665 RepID=UPI001E534E56